MSINKKETRNVIACPYCGHEFLPDEIFMPGDIIGKSDDIVKDALGKILYADYLEGQEPCQDESYICDGCGKAFKVKVSAKYTAVPEDEEVDFSKESASLL